MKRSHSVRRLLLGGLSAGALTATAATASAASPISTDDYFTNNHQVPGAGYYHAPFHAFFPLPYNHYDPDKKMYFFGGQWGPEPFRSIVNISAPTPEAVRQAAVVGVGGYPRSGFGRTSTSHFTHS